jgi:putative intracellular protease/amidase
MRHRNVPVVLFLSVWLTLIPARADDKPAPPRPVRIAVYDDAGIGRSLPKLLKVLGARADFHIDRLKAKDIQTGKLAGYDVVIFPGGTGSGQAKAIGETGRKEVQDFVKNGGGFVGICAGAYLATCDYSWSFALLNAKVIDRKHWARGVGDVDIDLSPEGKDLLRWPSARVTIHYHQGPLLAPAKNASLPAYQEMATFVTEIAKNGAPPGIMKGTTAAARADFGKGRVFCFSPHPELTDGLDAMLHQAVLWTARR